MTNDIRNLKSRIIVDSNFIETVSRLKTFKIPSNPTYSIDSSGTGLEESGRVTRLEPSDAYNLDARNGGLQIRNPETLLCAYDESIAVYEALEGRALAVSHALVYLYNDDFVPITYMTLKFLTRSNTIASTIGKSAIVTDNPQRKSSLETARDKMTFLEEYCVDGSILLIDGAMIAGDAFTTFIQQMSRFEERNILPIFFIKNSSSNNIVSNIEGMSEKYNSDLHWANEMLRKGQRSCFFEYIDLYNDRNAKVFCYVKFLEGVSPVRIEIPSIVFRNPKFERAIGNVMDVILYLLLVQGSGDNCQIRPIAIAEKYARETMKLIDVNKEIRRAGLIPTMNEKRGMIK